MEIESGNKTGDALDIESDKENDIEKDIEHDLDEKKDVEVVKETDMVKDV